MPKVRCFLFFCLLLPLSDGGAENQVRVRAGFVGSIPQPFLERLAQAQWPAGDGALGRNRKGYFHVRFQYRMHHLMDYAVHTGDQRYASAFFKALRYGFNQQQAAGSFRFQPPSGLSGQRPSAGDLASGAAFFLASAASGLRAFERESGRLARGEADAAALPGRLRAAADYLQRKQETLLTYDALAPNRLLIDALALISLARLLADPELESSGHRSLSLALAQQHCDGYFVEAGGFDSSYNGVALAVGYRLLLQNPELESLRVALEDSARWQLTRILPSGEISTDGNARVHPGGEQFLGREKEVDVSHVVEGLLLAFAESGDGRFLNAARQIADFYL
ncbi:MAG: hypothetical protein AAGA23_20975 [Pseudomonadota bacterium]